METPPEPTNVPASGARLTRQHVATVLVVVGVAWTLLTGACTGGVALFTMGVALIFGAPLVLGGWAVWVAGRLLRGDPRDKAIGRRARFWAVVSALGTVAAIGLVIWSAPQHDEYGLGQMLAMFGAAGAVGALVLLATSLRMVWLSRQAAGPGAA